MASISARSWWVKFVGPFLVAAVVLAGRAGSTPRPAWAEGANAMAVVVAPNAVSDPPRVTTNRKGSATLDELRARYNPLLLQGLRRLRASQGGAAEDHVVGDSTDAAGMHWTKCTNLGLDLLATLVAEQRGLMAASEARAHVRKVLDVLGGLRTYHGILPEIILMDGGLRAEVKEGRIRYSSIDSAWVTVALTLVQARYQARPSAGGEAAPELAARAEALVSGQDYRVFLGPDGLLGAGVWVDAKTFQVAKTFGFSYGDQNSEARPLVLALVGLGKLPSSAFDNMRATWTMKEGLPVIQGWHSSAFVEMTGQLLLDEMALAPLSLGRSHINYVEATTRVADRRDHAVWGYAPACDLERGYSEYGLDRADLVSPYAGGLLTLTGDPRAISNLERILAGLADDGRPMPDGLDPKTGRVICDVARTLDQSLLFLSLNGDVVRGLARGTAWYASAAQRLRALDDSQQPPGTPPTVAPPARPAASGGAGATLAPAPGALPRPVATAGSGIAAPTAGSELKARADAAAATPSPLAARLSGVLADMRRSDAEAGGATDLARSELHLASATAVRAWADFSPELVWVLRHPFSASLFDPSFRMILQAQFALSLDKLWTARAAGDARVATEASVHQQERGSWARGLEGYFALFLAERRVALLREHRASLATFASGLSAGEKPGAANDLVLLKARLSAVDAALADAEATRELALGRLGALTGKESSASGLDPHLDLRRILGLVDAVTRDADETDEERVTAEIEQQRSLLARVDSQAPYVPELRAGGFVDVPRVDVSTANATTAPGWSIDRVIGSLSLAFAVRPEQDDARVAATSAIESRQHVFDQIRQTRAARIAEARTRLRARLDAWSIHPEAIAEKLYREVGDRLKHGEVEVSAVIAASGVLLDSHQAAERIFGEAVSAGLALGALGVQPLSNTDSHSDKAGEVAVPATLSPGEAAAAGRAALLSAPGLRAVAAEAARAKAEAARARRDSWRLGLEAGLAYPLRTGARAAFEETVGPPVTHGTLDLASERIREPTVLGRLALEFKGNREAEQAAAAESELRGAEEELARKSHLAEQARARLDLALARTLARAAGKLAARGAEQLRLAQQMQSEGLTDEKTAVQEAELRASAASTRWMEAEETVQQAVARTNRLLGRPIEAPLSIAETPEQLMAWLRQTHYPSHGLLGYRRALGVRVAELEQRRANSRLAALRHPASAVDLSVQGTEQLRGYGRSVGVALAFRLGSVRDQAQLLEAARLAGASQGRIRGEIDRLEAERQVAHAEREAAARAQTLLTASQGRLTGILEDLRRNQAALPELNASAKTRARQIVEAQLEEAECRGIEAGARVARAELALLELDDPAVHETPPAVHHATGAVDTAIDKLVTSDTELDAAVGAARSVAVEKGRQPPGLLAGLHLAGPTVGASYGVSRATSDGRSTLTLRDDNGFVAAGINESFAESLAFLGTRHQVRAADQGEAAARQRAEARALADLSRLWNAREHARSAARVAAESRRRLEDLAVPRYHAGQINEESLALAVAAAANAAAAQDAAGGIERKERATLATRGVIVSDQTLDDLARRTDPVRLTAELAQAGLARWEKAELAPAAGAELTAARSRRQAAEAETGLAYVGLLGPATVLLELDAQRSRTAVEAPAPGQTEMAGKTAFRWVSSLLVPVRPKALADGGEAGARADLRGAEVGARERAFRDFFRDMRLRLSGAAGAWRTAERALVDANLAFAEVDRRYRQGLDGADSSRRAQAQDDLFASEDRARAARGVLMTLLAPLQRHLP